MKGFGILRAEISQNKQQLDFQGYGNGKTITNIAYSYIFLLIYVDNFFYSQKCRERISILPKNTVSSLALKFTFF